MLTIQNIIWEWSLFEHLHPTELYCKFHILNSWMRNASRISMIEFSYYFGCLSCITYIIRVVQRVVLWNFPRVRRVHRRNSSTQIKFSFYIGMLEGFSKLSKRKASKIYFHFSVSARSDGVTIVTFYTHVRRRISVYVWKNNCQNFLVFPGGLFQDKIVHYTTSTSLITGKQIQ